jgi:hypothetical protein
MSRRHPLAGDRGAASVEVVLATPLALTMMLLVVQFGLWLHAQHIADAAATQAVAAARVDGGTTRAGTDQAHIAVNQFGDGPLHIDWVSVSRGADQVEVRIEGRCTAVIPMFDIPVAARARGPVERPSSTQGLGL